MLFAALLLYSSAVVAQRTEYPLIGAQVFIEPGQTPEQIDGFFATMKSSGMEVGRIRMFGVHMLRDGKWDFTLYDRAFDAARRNGVRLFATLFPPTDELTDVGGFKFPHSKAHLNEVADYIKAVVTHFKGHPALYCWVLQNEPGTGGVRVKPADLSREKFAEWKALQKPSAYNDGYLKADFTDEKFLVWYTDWYLRWIAGQVDRYDKGSFKHVNPHQILSTLPEYDFTAYHSFLTSLGASMHMSWHFGWFTKAQYPLGVSVMADIIREGAAGNPFWITELQGGNVTASGEVPYCPTGGEIAQYLWTGIGAGSQGVVFWTLNPRASVMEAGEWAMIDFQGRPSDRLQAATAVIGKVKENAAFFRDAQPVLPAVTLLYNVESMRIQRRNAGLIKDAQDEGRMAGAPMKSLVAAYEAISALGVAPQIASMERFDWEHPAGQVAVLADMVSLPSYYWDRIRAFVRGGGKLIVTGLSGFYDENMRCLFMGGFPLADCFGGNVAEFKVVAPRFDLPLSDPALTLPAHLWRGTLAPRTWSTATPPSTAPR
jgi:beta-galactosidase